MSSIVATCGSPSSAPAKSRGRLVTFGVALWHLLGHELRLRRDTRELQQLSDHLLRDVGLRRVAVGDDDRFGKG